MVELWKAYNEIREYLAGKKTYIVATLAGILGALRLLGYPIPDAVWPLLGALELDAVKAAVDKWKNIEIPDSE